MNHIKIQRVMTPYKTPGEFRHSQNWSGQLLSERCKMNVEDIQEAMSDLEKSLGK